MPNPIPVYRIVPAKCKFCGKELQLQIDAEYFALGDPYKLVPAAACNRCGDLLHSRFDVSDKVRRICLVIMSRPRSEQSDAREAAKPPLRRLLQRYCGIAEDWQHGELGEWDEAILEAVVGAPDKCGEVLNRLWLAAKTKPAQPALL